MPELPEIDGYVRGVEAHVRGQTLVEARLLSPFLLRTVEPAIDAAVGREVVGAERIGKRVALAFEGDLFFVLHLMVAGRLRWKSRDAKIGGKAGLLALDFDAGSLHLTEQGSKRRASLHVVEGRESLAAHDPGGLDVMTCTEEAFAEALTTSGHTVKRALCSPKIFSGIGNAWSDEILWEARMSPMQRGGSMKPDDSARLLAATRKTLREARERHLAAAEKKFPDKVTAFQPEMAVHGRFKEPCPRCTAPIQRITRASGHDFHYCAACQNAGKILADRSLSRLLKDDWPKRIEELMD